MKFIAPPVIACLETSHSITQGSPMSPTLCTSPVVDNTPMPSSEIIDKLVSEKTVITFCCKAIKNRGNVRGIIKEYGYAASISPSNLMAFRFATKPHVGDEFTAIVERWDENASVFNLKSPD